MKRTDYLGGQPRVLKLQVWTHTLEPAAGCNGDREGHEVLHNRLTDLGLYEAVPYCSTARKKELVVSGGDI